MLLEMLLPDVLADVSMKLLKVICKMLFVCLYAFCFGIRDVADVVVLPELLDVDELIGILDVVVVLVVLVDLDIVDLVDVIDEVLCLELVDGLVVLLVLL